MTTSYRENAGAKMRRTIYDFASAKEAYVALSRGGDKLAKLGNNTWIDLRREAGIEPSREYVVIILHNTVIVKYYDDGIIELNSGGYQTTTTKARMNEVLPPGVRVSQTKREWFVHTRAGADIKFFDGMTLEETTRGYLLGHRLGRFDTPFEDVMKRKPRKNPGKFDSDFDEWAYHLSLDGGNQEAGDVSQNGVYYVWLENVTPDELLSAAESVGNDDVDVRKVWYRDFRGAKQINIILEENDQGFVSASAYTSHQAAERAWNRILDELGEDDDE